MKTETVVFGDSFGTPHTDWENCWSTLISHNVYAMPGTNLWYSYQKFLKHYKSYDYVVFVYTHKCRWYTIAEHLLPYSNCINKEKLDVYHGIPKYAYDDMAKLVEVYKLIYDEDFEQFLYQTIFDKVNTLCRKRNIKLINVLPFEPGTNVKSRWTITKEIGLDISNMHGSCLVGLGDISWAELTDADVGGHRHPLLKKYTVDMPDARPCHLSPWNNKALAEIITEEFANNNPRLIDLTFDDRFSYDISILLDYFNKMYKSKL